jgi:predicted outer membrane repeat protein
MWFSSWLGRRQRSAARGRSHGSPRTRPSYRPRLEALEDRWLPSQIGLTVTSLTDSGPGTLRAAIQTADAGSPSNKYSIGFAVNGTIDLQSPLPDLNNTIAVQGPGASRLTVERAAGASFASAIVTVDASQTASLSGLTVSNGNAGGILNNGGNLTVANCAVVNNSAAPQAFFGFSVGGGIFNSIGTLTVSGCTISGNSASFGGGIYSDRALTINGTTVYGNSATGFTSDVHINGAGGGIYADGTMTVSGCKISGNSTDGSGGGMEVTGGGGTVSGCTLCGNSAFWGGGIDAQAPLTISASTLSGNIARGGGGGMRIGGSVTVSGCTFTRNSATGFTFSSGLHLRGSGGAIYMNFTNNAVRDSSFNFNSAELGGAIYNPLPGLTVSGCTFNTNSATEGGGVYNDASATLEVHGNTFTSNTASDSGGGIYNLGTATLQECTLSANTAGSAGGGIFNGASGTLTIDDSVVTGNLALLGADLYNLGKATLNDSTVGVIGP